MPRYTTDQKLHFINTWRESGLSVLDYCKSCKINKSTFYYWLRQEANHVDDVPTSVHRINITHAETNSETYNIKISLPSGIVIHCKEALTPSLIHQLRI